MPEGKYGRSYRHQRKQRLSYSNPSPYVGNSFFSNDQIAILPFSLSLMRSSG